LHDVMLAKYKKICHGWATIAADGIRQNIMATGMQKWMRYI